MGLDRAALPTPRGTSLDFVHINLTGVFGFFALLRAGIRDNLDQPVEVLVVFDGEQGVAKRRAVDGVRADIARALEMGSKICTAKGLPGNNS
jgi:hypothetical protein